MRLHARSSEEADLYVDLECEMAGQVPVERKRKKRERRGKPFMLYEARCQSGKLLEFEFEIGGLPDPKPGLRRTVSYGGAQPSLIIDAGEWMLVSNRMAEAAPKSVSGLSERKRREAASQVEDAIAALDEVVKFIPAKDDAVSSSSLFSPRGKTYFNKDIRRFRRQALADQRTALEARLRRFRSHSV